MSAASTATAPAPAPTGPTPAEMIAKVGTDFILSGPVTMDLVTAIGACSGEQRAALAPCTS